MPEKIYQITEKQRQMVLILLEEIPLKYVIKLHNMFFDMSEVEVKPCDCKDKEGKDNG